MPRRKWPSVAERERETPETNKRDEYTLKVYYSLDFVAGLDTKGNKSKQAVLEYLASGGLAERRDDGLWYRVDDPCDRQEEMDVNVVKIIGGRCSGYRKMKASNSNW